jgi:hypothetical protein
MSAGTRRDRDIDACRPFIVWAPKPYCTHDDDDCEHGVWVDTRVTRDTLAGGWLLLALRELDEDDFETDDVAVDNTITVTCTLDTGGVAATGTEGVVFLRRHPWLADALREQLPLFRERAERAAAQLDRESAAREVLARPSTTMVRYSDLFPADWDLLLLHDGDQYWAVDLYCRNPDCDCTSSVIYFYRVDDDDEVHRVGEVTIDYAKDDPAVEPSSKEVGKVFDSLWASCEYKLRARHAEASQAVRRFAKRPTAVPARTAGPRVPRNAVCPCGSGKKYKRCCLDVSSASRPGGTT